MKKLFISLIMIILPLVASAYDIEVKNADGVTIYYNYINDRKELMVTSGETKYTGNVVIPEEVSYMNRTRKVTIIDDYAFYGCTGLSTVTISNSVKSIGQRAFKGCSGLTTVTIGNSVKWIGESAFYGCSGLTTVTIGNGMTYIGDIAFKDCTALKKVIVHDIAAWCGIKFGSEINNPLGVGYSNPLFYANHLYSDENTEIKDLVIPNSVTSIGDNTFLGCTGLTSVTIGNSVTSIGVAAFIGCSGLTSVTIPNSVTSISQEAFMGCSGLTSITIPNSVTRIGHDSFNYCSSLSSVIIGSGVTIIGERAFIGADVTTVISLIENPFITQDYSSVKDAFSTNTFKNGTLFVPIGSGEKYKTAEGWKKFNNIVEGKPTKIESIHTDSDKETSIYNLKGNRLEKPTKGINIVNGKKVIFK